jgi:hypothetical protein
MPTNPTPAQSAAARANGARSKGAVTPEGRARLGEAATRHNLTGVFRLLPGEDQLAFERLRRAWHARLLPIDQAEREAADGIVHHVWRRMRLDALEELLLSALIDGRPTTGLPSLATICRYRARLEKDRREAERELVELRDGRPQRLPIRSLNPDRLIWLAHHVHKKQVRAEDELEALLLLDPELEQAGPDPAGPEPAEPEPAEVVPLRPRPH